MDRSIADLQKLVVGFKYGRIVREGLTLAIVGRPNVGKSSLFNRLLNEERAIVTPLPGTTRDTVTETINVGGIPLRFVDTAGIREASMRSNASASNVRSPPLPIPTCASWWWIPPGPGPKMMRHCYQDCSRWLAFRGPEQIRLPLWGKSERWDLAAHLPSNQWHSRGFGLRNDPLRGCPYVGGDR